MSTKLTQNKSVLARLLAGENFDVRHDEYARTASFDVSNRVLTVPIWKDMDSDLYDLFMGHEVGHALFTPEAGAHAALSDRGPAFKAYLNVCEDVRIERLIQSRYPGLRRPFVMGYKDLVARKFFGDISNLKLLADRLNVFAKIGSMSMVSFTADEQVIVDAVFAAETFEETVAATERLFAFDKQNNWKDKEPPAPKTNSLETEDGFAEVEADESEEADAGDDGEESEEAGHAGEESEEAGDDGEETEEAGAGSEEADGEEDGSEAADGEATDGEEADPMPSTETEFRRREHELIADRFYQKSKLVMRVRDSYESDVIVPNEEVIAGLEELMSRRVANPVSFRTQLDVELRKMKPDVTHLLNEFEMRKNADQFARARVAKSGKLDMGRLSHYRTSEDIFRRRMVVSEGKNHGMVFVFDQSGSMHAIYRETMLQMFALIEFCRAASIPFAVYGFGDSTVTYPSQVRRRARRDASFKKDGAGLDMWLDPKNNGFLRDYLNSEMPLNQLRYVQSMMLEAASGGMLNCSEERLGSTPMMQAIVATADVVTRFREKHNVQVMNTVLLTDGQPTDSQNLPYGFDVQLMNKNGMSPFRSAMPGMEFMRDHSIGLANCYLRATTGSRIIGLYVPDSERAQKKGISEFTGTSLEARRSAAKARDMIEKKGYAQMDGANGFDHWYVTRAMKGQQQVRIADMTKAPKNAKEAALMLSTVGASSKNKLALLSAFAEVISGDI